MADLPDLADGPYVDRINRAVDYVTENLASPLPLDDVASAAGFSSFYFHRLFRAFMGETLAAFVKRTRLERAVYLLSHRPRTSFTEIALACGFSSSSDFSRSFRAHYGVPPRKFDLDQHRATHREEMRGTPNRLPAGANPDSFQVTLCEAPTRHVAYIRVHRPYEGTHVPDAVARLLAWADQRGLAGGQWLGYQWDDPEIVPLEKIRYDVGVEIPRPIPADGEVSVATFPATLMAEIEIKGNLDVELRALDWLFFSWLPRSGYAPAHQPMFEAFNDRPFAHGTDYFELRTQLAVVPIDTPL